MSSTLSDLQAQIDNFVIDRDWEQFHTPKNLTTALVVEAAELAEHFQWMTPEASDALSSTERDAVADEIGDVLIYLLLTARRVKVDPVEAATTKLKRNADRYPVDQSRGVAGRPAT